MRAIKLTIVILLLMASTAWAGDARMLLAVMGGGFPADETFDTSAFLSNWTSGGWGWESTSYSGGGAFIGYGGGSPSTHTLTKTFKSSRAGVATVYSRIYNGSASTFTLCSHPQTGTACVSLNSTSTWTKSATVPIDKGDTVIDISVTATTVGAEVDQLEFR